MSPGVGEKIRFQPKKGRVREGVVAPGFVDTATHIKVLLDGDPFPVDVLKSQVSSCKEDQNVVPSSRKVPKYGSTTTEKRKTMTATKPNAKALRKQAQALGVEGWEDMGRAELAKAVKRAQKAADSDSKSTKTKSKAAKTKKASKKGTKAPKSKPADKPAKKAPAKRARKAEASGDDSLGISLPKGTPRKPLPDEGANPFRKSSNLFIVGNLLLKGGTRRTLAEKLASKVELHPYNKDAEDIDLLDYDKRLLLGAQTMRDQFGYGIQRQGRGLDGKILVFRPGGPKDPRGNGAGQKARKSATKKSPGKAKRKS